MDDLLKKLNTLVSAQVNDLASKLPGFERKPDVSRQVSDLRERVNTAMAHEEQLRNTVLSLRDEIAIVDGRVNEALQNGQEPIARGLLDQMQRLEKRLAFAEADLRQHQASAADLIGRVSALEAAVQTTQEKANPPTQTQAATSRPAQRTTGAPSGAGSIGAMMDAALNSHDAPAPQQADSNAPKAKEKVKEKRTDKPTPEKPSGQAQNIKPADAPVDGAIPKPWTPIAGTAENGGQSAAAAPEQQKSPEKPAVDEQPAEKSYTAKDLARDAREGAEKQLERTNEGFESVGGLLRDIQSRTKSRMESLDKMLREGGLLDPDETTPPTKSGAASPDKSTKSSDLEERLKRLSKPD